MGNTRRKSEKTRNNGIQKRNGKKDKTCSNDKGKKSFEREKNSKKKCLERRKTQNDREEKTNVCNTEIIRMSSKKPKTIENPV